MENLRLRKRSLNNWMYFILIGPGRARPLGLRHSMIRCALFDPYTEGALVLFTPPELSAHDALKLDTTNKQVNVVPLVSYFNLPMI